MPSPAAACAVALAQDAPWQWPGVSHHLGSSGRNVLAVKVAILHLALRTELCLKTLDLSLESTVGAEPDP